MKDSIQAFCQGAAGVDEHGVGAVEAAPVRHGVGDELRSVVEAHVDRGAPLAGETLEAVDDVIGVDGAVHVDGQALPAVLVDHVQQLQLAAIGGLVELEVHRPHHVRPDRAHRPDRLADAPQRLLPLAVGHPQALFPPQAVDPLPVGLPARFPGFCGRPAPSPAGTFPGELPQPGPQSELIIGRDWRGEPLGGAGLAHHLTCPPFGDPEPFLQDPDGLPAAVRGQKFPRFNSFNMSISSA